MARFKVLAKKVIKNSEKIHQCIFCGCKLGDFLHTLPKDYDEYDIQRDIVKNVYLDRMIDTVIEKKHIPPIILVGSRELIGEEDFIEDEEFSIIDGLQRTYRLMAIYQTFLLIESELCSKELISLSNRELLNEYRKHLTNINSSIVIMRKLIDYIDMIGDVKAAKNELFNQEQWFELWLGLTIDDEVDKMLVLNAGHKQVTARHQLELLFIKLYPKLKEIGNGDIRFELIREKQMTPLKLMKVRKVGMFHFSNLIAASLSFEMGKPLKVNSALINKIQSDEESTIERTFDIGFVTSLTEFLVNVDVIIENEYGNEGLGWLSKETVLTGIIGAIGKYQKESKMEIKEVFNICEEKIFRNNVINIKGYEEQRYNINVSKVNVGDKSRQAVFSGVYDCLINHEVISDPINWIEYFQGGQSK